MSAGCVPGITGVCDNCPNAVTVDEEELIEVLQEYFAELLKAKKNVIRYVVGEFQRVYKAKDENLNYEKELNAQPCKAAKNPAKIYGYVRRRFDFQRGTE